MNKIIKIGYYLVMIVLSIYFIGPIYWMIISAIKPPNEIFTYPPVFFPSKINFKNFVDAWNAQPFALYLKNSLIIVLFNTLGQVFSCTLVAYGFARYKFKGRELLFTILLATMMIPWDVTMIPQYVLFKALKWIDTLKPFIIPAWFGSPFYIFLLRQFLLTIPKELEEAAAIDGANDFQIFLRIFIPLIIPAIMVLIIFNFLTCWNDFLGPLIFINNPQKYTLMLGVAQFRGLHHIEINKIMAITTIASIPPLVLYIFAQRYITEGIVSVSVKG
ncbi:carbohydrate ABC transporter permease [Dictyoglomus thermophilum]|uniref:Sugar uptake ABC transporter permease protein n=1 Tax=Dictyoglomus thermophilum (strain ATCC 35947 / DSM 3960 / H-6-12) TaxID=309799 RepID=B5YBF5_DICT6|nr:carbohydrate ABC transporter permease [Dictyoglomus thermophilum]ACI19825.1 putative sugar uptake ABC transporter permease protein [Dictyoglomus thermophilum H-6-12]